VTRRRHAPELREQCVALVANGASMTAVARAHHLDYQTVQGWCRVRGVRSQHVPWSSRNHPKNIPHAQRAVAVNAVRRGATQTEAARLAGVSQPTVSRWMAAA
jgi:transposase-like protein